MSPLPPFLTGVADSVRLHLRGLGPAGAEANARQSLEHRRVHLEAIDRHLESIDRQLAPDRSTRPPERAA